MKAKELKAYCTGDCEGCKFLKQPEYYPCSIIGVIPCDWNDDDFKLLDSFVELMNKEIK